MKDCFGRNKHKYLLLSSLAKFIQINPQMAPFDLDACIQQLLRKQLLHEALLREICEKTKEVLMRESNVVHVSAPVTVVGDIHGWVPFHNSWPSLIGHSSQFYDLIEIFRIGGYAPNTNYLFLGTSRDGAMKHHRLINCAGDYVDRGLFSVETISLLTCLKLRYPDRVQLIRGNHESRAVTQVRFSCYVKTHNWPFTREFRRMGFILNVFVNTDHRTCGHTSRICSTSWHCQWWLMTKYFACMAVSCPLASQTKVTYLFGMIRIITLDTFYRSDQSRGSISGYV